MAIESAFEVTEVLKLTRVDDCCGCGCYPLRYEDSQGETYELDQVRLMIQAGTAVEEGVRQIT